MNTYDQDFYRACYTKTRESLSRFSKIVFLTTSNRWSGEKHLPPKSTRLAHTLAKDLKNAPLVIEVADLTIYPCEGNISSERGNFCGPASALLKDASKNPSGYHRCWASVNNKDDELWKISKPLLEADCVIFFGSIRWGQMNAVYQNLIERLTWLENRHSTLGESKVLETITTGIIAVGHNWNGDAVVSTQKKVLSYFGFSVNDDLCWNWAYTTAEDETADSYRKATQAFKETFLL